MTSPLFQTGVANHDSSNQHILSISQTAHARCEQKRSVTPQLQTVSFSSGHYHHHTPVVRNPALPFAAGSRHQASEINQQALLQHIAGQSSSQVSFSTSTQVTNSILPAISRKLSASRASSTDSAHTLQFVQSGEETSSSAGAPPSFFQRLFQPARNPTIAQNVVFAAPKGSTSKTTRLTPYHRTNSINVNHSQSNQLQPGR
ncbi:hypothetical protein [Candidatus Regiella insecticola]|uniref:hypothetical protein n=1 Tax=Candidatus Regiella insecticola TaxID=138073 RepID=UPI001596BF33|nr:hypothetical protein [Candidatus Regiella insecticola]